MKTVCIGEGPGRATFGRRIFGRLPFLLIIAAIATALACEKGATVTGHVVSAQTGEPVAGANVEVHFRRLDANYNWLDGGRAELTSGPNGEFSANSSDIRTRFVVFAQRDGFYPNFDCQPVRRLKHRTAHLIHTVEIRLCPIVSPQSLPRGQGEVRFYPPGRRMGWNFAGRQMVPERESDIVGDLDESGRKIATLTALGRGGFAQVRGLSGEWALFNTPTAPRDGYRQRVDLREVAEGERTCYYVRTADGARYAKIVVGGALESRNFRGVRFDWVYQPNGSPALEIPLR